MATVSSITLKNAAAVNVVFNREVGLVDGVILRDSTETVYSKAARLKLTTKLPSPSSKVARMKQTFTYPVYDATTGALLHTLTKIEEWIIPQDATKANRDEFHARTKEASISSVVTAAISNLDFAN